MDALNSEARKENENYLTLQELLHVKSDLDESCILHQSLSLIADKWTLLVLMALMQGTKRNSELQRQIKGISPKMLTQTLKTLISYGMVDRKAYPEVPPRVEYCLTEFGISTADPLTALLNWSVAWEEQLVKLYKEKVAR
ncbi:helix-turn-helix domain-containing protein [uncultured Chryseobacterium sp.]|uniref:winged helix-turn-helix transcriptional regulator n=1 Tax=uncultured Chryseobacterium sp. TaxID=259322 RepID=UPI0025F03624|nr:helix-turn-helix domain-containing protein [uncultured Chryseobacterium sp.]